MKIHTAIDRFVDVINGSVDLLYPLEEDEVPAYLRIGEPDEYGQYSWKIRPRDGTQWLKPVVQTLFVRFPPSYYSLVSRYAFAAIHFPAVMLFANTGERVRWELVSHLTECTSFASQLLPRGFLQCGIPDDGHLDPICFDTNQGRREHPLVQLDHEALIQYSEIRVITEIAPSFLTFVNDVITLQPDR